MALEGILQINEILNDYKDDIQQGISSIAQEIAKEDVNKLKNTTTTYKVRSGKYNKGWTVKTTRGMNSISCVVHNKDQYQLTHLLEYGHQIKRNGTKVGDAKAYQHIEPVEKQSNEKYSREVESLIRSGGKV